MTDKEYMDQGEQYLIHTYNRFKIVLDKGEGVYLYDVNGKKYLDFAAGIAVFALGYGNKEYNDALKAQIDKLIHTSNLYYNVPAIEAAKKVVEASGLKKAFFTNSGAEAIEGALKMAKRYAYDRDKNSDHEVIAMNHSFHGRTMGALALTGNSHYQEPFGPMISGIKFAEFNNLDSVKALINEKTAKALGCGVPVGAFVAGEKCCDSLVPGDHGTTYGGNPLATAAVSKVFDLFEEMNILEHVNEVSNYLEEQLDKLVEQYDNVVARRGKGLMQGLVLTTPVIDTVNKAIEKGLLVISAGSDVLRMVPPLVITKENVDEMIEILSQCL